MRTHRSRGGIEPAPQSERHDSLSIEEREVISRKLSSRQSITFNAVTEETDATRQAYGWLAVVAVATLAFCAPFIRNIADYSDEGVLLHGAERMLRGETLYLDFFEFLPPGGFVLTATWFRLVGLSMLSARLLVLFTITAIACFTYLSCLRASRRPMASAVIALCWVGLSQGLWTQFNHHWFTTLFSMITLWATLAGVQQGRKQRRYTLLAGLASGIAAMITPTRGVLAMLAGACAYINIQRRFKEVLMYGISGLLVPLLLVAMLFYQNSLVAAFYSVIEFAATRYSSIQGVSFGHNAGRWDSSLILLFQLTPVYTLFIVFGNWRTWLQDRVLIVCIAFGVAGFIGSYPRPDLTHISFAAPLMCPLLAYCVNHFSYFLRPLYTRAAIAVGILLASVFFAVFLENAKRALSAPVVTTSRGDVSFFGDARASQFEEMIAFIAEIPQDDGFYFYPFTPLLPFLTAREHVSRYDVLIPGYSSPSQYSQACQSVQEQARWVVIDRVWTDANNLASAFPSMQDTSPPERMLFEQILRSEFAVVSRFGNFEILQRNDSFDKDEFACKAITQ